MKSWMSCFCSALVFCTTLLLASHRKYPYRISFPFASSNPTLLLFTSHTHIQLMCAARKVSTASYCTSLPFSPFCSRITWRLNPLPLTVRSSLVLVLPHTLSHPFLILRKKERGPLLPGIWVSDMLHLIILWKEVDRKYGNAAADSIDCT